MMTWQQEQIEKKLLLPFFIAWLMTLAYFIPAGAQSYTPPTQITVTMYALNSDGNITTATSGDQRRCSITPRDLRFGCTAFPNDSSRAYPFNANPITVQIEGTTVENRYLRDVLPREISVAAFHPTAIRVQAIAARTYAYWHIRQGSTINNSISFQAFVPRQYDLLSGSEKSTVDTALQSPQYVSEGATPFPIFSEFFADIPSATVNGDFSYLRSVPEPISSYPAITQDGHGRGMSQKGSSRWARGNLSFNLNDDLGKWSTAWTDHLQIFTHYYTGIHVRNASNTATVTPAKRWVPLKVNWGVYNPTPDLTCAGSHTFSIWLQNTSTSNWSANEVSFVVLNNGQPFTSVNIPTSVTAGSGTYTATATVNLSPNTYYYFRFDMKVNSSNTLFSSQSPVWPNYIIPSIYVISCPNRAYLPAIQSPAVTQ